MRSHQTTQHPNLLVSQLTTRERQNHSANGSEETHSTNGTLALARKKNTPEKKSQGYHFQSHSPLGTVS
ncbi:MAG: hypothetical protein AAFQ83_26690, partial [Bacteroidota bacterium]